MDKLGKIIKDYEQTEDYSNTLFCGEDVEELMKIAYNKALEDFDENVVYDNEGHLMYINTIENLKIK